ncbi:pyridoxal phosphate-dependent aminotransferase [Candidatus Falkowbacteria bacterium]|nr:pyridoxal phosphate-dependent aminotransferase [Candidatus Falkowbacteria bacterium]
MSILSKRIEKLEGSGIRKIFDLAAKSKGEFVNLSIGQPDFKVPANLKKAAKTAIGNDCNSYSATAGVSKLKQQIALKLQRDNGIKAKEDEIIVTSGVSGAIFLLLASILDPGDEVILPDPYFVVYEQAIKFLDAKAVLLDTYPDFHIDVEKLEKMITSKTKALVINTPNNPTGAVLSKRELQKIAKVARKHGLLVISDEIYEAFDYEQQFASMGSVYKNTVTLNGYSKSHAITGWRVGYAHGPKEIIASMNKLQQYTFVCAPSFAQHALANEPDFNFAPIAKQYKKKRDLVYQGLKDKYELNMPEGAFYAFIKIPAGRKDFINELIKHGVLVVPGSVFSQKDSHFRLCFAVDDAVLRKGIEIIRSLA